MVDIKHNNFFAISFQCSCIQQKTHSTVKDTLILIWEHKHTRFHGKFEKQNKRNRNIQKSQTTETNLNAKIMNDRTCKSESIKIVYNNSLEDETKPLIEMMTFFLNLRAHWAIDWKIIFNQSVRMKYHKFNVVQLDSITHSDRFSKYFALIYVCVYV